MIASHGTFQLLYDRLAVLADFKEIANLLKKTGGEEVKEIRCYDMLSGGASGGTLETLFHSFSKLGAYKVSRS